MTSADARITVLLADDNLLVREGVRALLRIAGDLDVVAMAEDYDGLVAQAQEHRPQVVVTDIRTRRVVAARPDTVVLLMSTYPASDLPQDARTSGARAYVHKEDLAPDVLVAVMTGELPPGF